MQDLRFFLQTLSKETQYLYASEEISVYELETAGI